MLHYSREYKCYHLIEKAERVKIKTDGISTNTSIVGKKRISVLKRIILRRANNLRGVCVSNTAERKKRTSADNGTQTPTTDYFSNG